MNAEWAVLPLLPLRCILEHLNTKDALAAMSTCRHWRQAIILYEGHRNTLKLRAKQLEQSVFVTRLFKKHTKRLHIYIDCNASELEKFINYVLPQFFDTLKLQEVMFIGPNYIQQNQHVPVPKLNRIITESLIFKHMHCIKKLAIMGCEMNVMKSDSEQQYVHKNVEYYSRPLSFNSVRSSADSVLSVSNINMMMFSSLQHIIMDYELVTTESLVTLSHLPMFSHLTMNIYYKRHMSFKPVDWHRLHPCYSNGLDVSVNIIALPQRKFDDVIENVLVEGLSLISLKVLFCKTMYAPLISAVVERHKDSLRELVWADCPHQGPEPPTPPEQSDVEYDDMCDINPFILLCWQCVNLRRLVIHGYWVWQYDLVGMVRLRKSLARLEVSALYGGRTWPAAMAGPPRAPARRPRPAAPPAPPARHARPAPPGGPPDVLRVTVEDAPPVTDRRYVHQINTYTDFEWSPIPWDQLHPGLRARSTAEEQADYIVQEVSQPLGII